MTNASIEQMRLQNVDLSMCRAQRSVWSTINRTRNNNIVCNSGDFRSAMFNKTMFRNADFSGSDFRDANFWNCAFINTDLTGARFEGAQFFETEIRSCTGFDALDIRSMH